MEFKFKDLGDALSYANVILKPVVKPGIEIKIKRKAKIKDIVAGGDPVREPVNKQTAIVVAPCAWWATPPPKKYTNTLVTNSNNKSTKKMSKTIQVSEVNQEIIENPNAAKIVRMNGQEYIDVNQVQFLVMQEVAKLPKEASPLVRQAKESREIIDQCLHGIGGDMEKFKTSAREHIEAIRATRYSIVSEVNTMMNALKDVRTFFMGSDHKEQIDRLRGFVELCERLQKLKEIGFLDAVADTIIKLDRPAN